MSASVIAAGAWPRAQTAMPPPRSSSFCRHVPKAAAGAVAEHEIEAP